MEHDITHEKGNKPTTEESNTTYELFDQSLPLGYFRIPPHQYEDEQSQAFMTQLTSVINRMLQQAAATVNHPQIVVRQLQFAFIAKRPDLPESIQQKYETDQAIAFGDNGTYFVAMTIDLFNRLTDLATTLAEDKNIQEVFACNEADASVLSRELLQVSAMFIVGHELGHLFLGHRTNQSTWVEFKPFEIGRTTTAHADELLADEVGANSIIINLTTREPGQNFTKTFKQETLLQAVTVGCAMFFAYHPQYPPDVNSWDAIHEHPPIQLRINHLWAIIDTHPAVKPEVRITKSQFEHCLQLMLTVYRNGETWNQVATLLATEPGQAYESRLENAYNARKAERSDWWVQGGPLTHEQHGLEASQTPYGTVVADATRH